MRTNEVLSLTSSESSLVTVSCALFGFEPTREVWYRHQAEINYEQMSSRPMDPRARPDMKVGWWTGWLNVGEVTDGEAQSMAQCLSRATTYYRAKPGVVPAVGFLPYPDWDWKAVGDLIASTSLTSCLPQVAEFMRAGAFWNTVRKEPYAVLLSRPEPESDRDGGAMTTVSRR